jgi:hypothetical protein
MNIKQIRELAKELGISPKKQNKTQLIHLIQQAEGNFPCFATAGSGECDQLDCLWRQDCLKASCSLH